MILFTPKISLTSNLIRISHIKVSVDSFVFICVFLFHTAYLLYHCERGGVDLMGLKPNPENLSSFSALTLLVGSADL